jgi:hypothetical protein
MWCVFQKFFFVLCVVPWCCKVKRRKHIYLLYQPANQPIKACFFPGVVVYTRDVRIRNGNCRASMDQHQPNPESPSAFIFLQFSALSSPDHRMAYA